jgi:hypothetical protein
MFSNLPIFCIFAVTPLFPHSDGRPTAAAAIQPQAILQLAVRTLESRGSISATIHQHVNLFGKQLSGSGSYWEVRQPGVPLVRLELRIQIGDQVSSLLQVCDGRTFWVYRNLSDKVTLGKIDAVRAMRGLQKAAEMPNRNAAMMLPGLGGLSRLLRGLDANFQFASAQWGNLEKTPGGFWRLEGGWRPEQLVRLLPKQRDAIVQGKPVDLTRLAEHLPDRVVLYLREGDLFPYRLEYHRAAAKKDHPAEADQDRAIVTMDLRDVVLNAAIEPARFLYSPGSFDPLDQTESFLQALGVKD